MGRSLPTAVVGSPVAQRERQLSGGEIAPLLYAGAATLAAQWRAITAQAIRAPELPVGWVV